MTVFKRYLQTTLVLIGILFGMVSCKTEKSNTMETNDSVKDTLSITILQTADIHGQLDTHPELFWENEKVVFKNRGGLANIKTLFDQERVKNPNRTIIVDGGDLIQGSGYTALSEGKAFALANPARDGPAGPDASAEADDGMGISDLQFDILHELKEEVAKAAPYGQWLRDNLFDAQDLPWHQNWESRRIGNDEGR